MKLKQLALLCLTFLMLLNFTGCGSKNYTVYELLPNEFIGEDKALDGKFQIVDLSQYTEDDIQKMNDGNASFVYNDEGYVTFINGRYSDHVVTNYEEAVGTVQQVAKLLGLNAGSEFFATYVAKDKNGYSYYTFQQKYGDETILYAALKVIVDPSGYTCGLSCSFTPNIGIYTESEDIGENQAMELVRERLINGLGEEAVENIRFYPEKTHKAAYTYLGKTYAVYCLYTDNPFTLDKTNFDMIYYEFFYTLDGRMVALMPVADFGTDTMDLTRNEIYFEGLETEIRTYELPSCTGGTETLRVPVSLNPRDGLYYLMDPERMIAVGDYTAMHDHESAELIGVSSPDDFPSYFIYAYDRTIQAYDYYNSFGYKSVDGTGIPLLVTVGMEDDNACYYGIHDGWGCFGYSPVNTYMEALDVVGHEYTHGITKNSMLTNKYLGITGAINESYSDIMGNLMEMMTGKTSDVSWIIAEKANTPLRSMSDPTIFNQPITVGDEYFADPANIDYDNGGVHVNSSLLSQMAYILHENGMSLQDESLLWIKTIEMITPLSEYEEVYQALLLSIDINGFDSLYKDVLKDAFTNAKMLE